MNKHIMGVLQERAADHNEMVHDIMEETGKTYGQALADLTPYTQGQIYELSLIIIEVNRLMLAEEEARHQVR